MNWVPVSERYPNKAGNYFATVLINGERAMGIVSFKVEKKKPLFYKKYSQEPLNVIAWMNLPKPYKGAGK